MKFRNKFFFPPRPKAAVPQTTLKKYSDEAYIAEPKLDGSNVSIYTNGIVVKAYNRHGELMTNFRLDSLYILNLYKDMKCKGWLVLNGEYLNKNKTGVGGRTFNHELVLFDILVLNDDYLVGTTFEHRYNLLYNSLKWEQHKEEKYLYSLNDKIHLVYALKGGASKIWNDVKDIEVFEGVVLKKANGKLEYGRSQLNTSKCQFKIRKATKNYNY